MAGCIETNGYLRTSIASAHGVKAGVDVHRALPLPTGDLPPS